MTGKVYTTNRLSGFLYKKDISCVVFHVRKSLTVYLFLLTWLSGKTISMKNKVLLYSLSLFLQQEQRFTDIHVDSGCSDQVWTFTGSPRVYDSNVTFLCLFLHHSLPFKKNHFVIPMLPVLPLTGYITVMKLYVTKSHSFWTTKRNFFSLFFPYQKLTYTTWWCNSE